MNERPERISLAQWDARYEQLRAGGLREPWYGGRLGRHAESGDLRLCRLRFDNSPAALGLWNLLLTEEDRLREARERGLSIVGAMKDLGTVPVLAYALDRLVAFYPDGAWWLPCFKERTHGLLDIADRLGINDTFCPVRAMLGAFETGLHFPEPDLLVCSVGAVCDDFSAIAQRLESLGRPILWWEVPHHREPDGGDESVPLPGGSHAPRSQVGFVKGELARVRLALEQLAGQPIDDAALARSIRAANGVRRLLYDLRRAVFTADVCPMPALEMLVAEMLALHFCSDPREAARVLAQLLAEVRRRVSARQGVLPADAVRIFWVNPVADVRVMNLLEDCGGRICGTDYLFSHALDLIPEDVEPLEALARSVLADPMVGPTARRAERICRDARAFGAQAMVISRIPGASHCAYEGAVIAGLVRDRLGMPVVEIEVTSVSDAMASGLATRLGALIESVRLRGSP